MKDMYKQTKKGLIIRMPKEIDHHTADEIRAEIDKKIEFNCISNLIFDFENTDFMDSSGIGLILGRYKMVQYLGGTVSVVNASDSITKMMNMSGIDKFINYFNV